MRVHLLGICLWREENYHVEVFAIDLHPGRCLPVRSHGPHERFLWGWSCPESRNKGEDEGDEEGEEEEDEEGEYDEGEDEEGEGKVGEKGKEKEK